MRSYKEKLKTHCLAGTTQFIPKGMPVLNKINKLKIYYELLSIR